MTIFDKMEPECNKTNGYPCVHVEKVKYYCDEICDIKEGCSYSDLKVECITSRRHREWVALSQKIKIPKDVIKPECIKTYNNSCIRTEKIKWIGLDHGCYRICDIFVGCSPRDVKLVCPDSENYRKWVAFSQKFWDNEPKILS